MLKFNYIFGVFYFFCFVVFAFLIESGRVKKKKSSPIAIFRFFFSLLYTIAIDVATFLMNVQHT